MPLKELNLSKISILPMLLGLLFILPACASKNSYSGNSKTGCPSSFGGHKTSVDAGLLEMLTEVHQEIDAAAGINTELIIVPGVQPNAYAWDKDKKRHIALNTALLEILGENVDEYAFVLAHEAAHISKGHIKKREDYDKSVKETSGALSLAMDAIGFGLGIPFSGLISSLTVDSGAHLMKMGYSRDNEREADREGLRYMADAGFKMTGALTFMEKLLSLPDSDSIILLSTHPHGEERIYLLKNEISLLNPNSQPGRINSQARTE